MQFVSHEARNWARLAELGDTVYLDTYDLVLNNNDAKSGYCYVVTDGFMVAKKARPERDSVTFSILASGSLLFEYQTLVGGTDRTVYYEALVPTVLRRVSREKLRHALDLNPKLNVTLMDSLYGKVVSYIDQLEDSNSRTAKNRLLTLLQELVFVAPAEDDGEWLGSSLRLSQQMMADLLCINRVTVAKSLKALGEEGLIRLDGRRILVARKTFEAGAQTEA